MDAVNFVKERDRMCRFYHHAGDCYQCPAKDCECSALEGMVDDDNIVTIVEEWAAVHPRKTRQTGLTPEQCENAKVIIEAAFSDDTSKAERIRELLKADKDGRLVVLPSNKALTNADCMRTATNQQLAKQIYDSQKELCRLMYKNLGFEDELEFSEDYSDILAWLNAPSKGAETALEAKKDE